MGGRSTVLVTGARKGIGRGLAQHYIEQGRFVVGCSRKPSSFRHPNYEHHELDVRDEEAVLGMLAHIRTESGGLNALINNAGVAVMNHSLLTPTKVARDVLETNVLGTFLLCREAAKLMRGAPHARMVNLSTVAAPLRLEGEAIYAASKAAVEMLTRILAKELAPLGITCNAVGPAPIETDLIRGVPAEKISRLLAQQAISRHATLEDIINVVDFFLRPESDFVTGQILYLGGVS